MLEFQRGAVNGDLTGLVPAPGGPQTSDSQLPKGKTFLFPPSPGLSVQAEVTTCHFEPNQRHSRPMGQLTELHTHPSRVTASLVSFHLLALHLPRLQDRRASHLTFLHHLFMPIPKISSTPWPLGAL